MKLPFQRAAVAAACISVATGCSSGTSSPALVPFETPVPSVMPTATPMAVATPTPTLVPTATPTAAATSTPAGAALVPNGDFSQGFAGWTQTQVKTGGFGASGFNVYNGGTCLSDPDGIAFYQSNDPGGAEGLLSEPIAVPTGNPQLSMLVWGALDPVTMTIEMTPQGGSPTVIGQFTPPTLMATETTCSGNVPIVETFSAAAFAGQTVTLGIDVTSQGDDGTIGDITRIGFSVPSTTLSRVRRR